MVLAGRSRRSCSSSRRTGGRRHWQTAWQLMLVLACLANLALARTGDGVRGQPNNQPYAFMAAGATPAEAKRLFEHQWRHHNHRLSALSIHGRSMSDLLGPVLDHAFELPPVQAQKSLVYLGANFRLRRVVHELIKGGKRVKVGAIGGSITHGAKASVIGETDWFSLLGKYMQRAFPHADVQTRNGALPATPSALMNMCLEKYVDDDVDLIFVEYAANDGMYRFDSVKPKVYERLLRKLLKHPNSPAVVLLQLMPKGMAFSQTSREKAWYPDTLEDIYGAQAQYYDLPWLSFRNAMWRLGEFHRYGYNWTDYIWDKDYMHPIDPGMRVIADMAVNLLQRTAMDLFLNPFGPPDRELLAEPLPPPMHRGNWEAQNILCIYGKDLDTFAKLDNSQGWEMVNEGKAKAPKWGYISRTPGSRLVLQINSTRATADHTGKMNLMLAYLKSYEHMGRATFECVENCECKPEKAVDAHHTLHTSTLYLVRLLVTQHEQCRIRITLLEGTSSGEHKFKVSGIMLNEYTGSDVTTRLHEEQWLTHLQGSATVKHRRRQLLAPAGGLPS